MYDLHAHILPGVDDGAKTMDDAVAMARAAALDGTKIILATPHRKDITQNFSVPYIQKLTADFNAELQVQGVAIKIVLGMENHLDIDLPEEFKAGRALCMNETKYALVELPFFGHPNYVSEMLFQIQVQGITPVLAHPERIEAVQQDPNLLAEFVERGMLSQVTAGSVVGHFGSKVKKFTNGLLKRGLVHVLASDTHFPQGPRSPIVTEGMRAAAAVVGEEAARRMVLDTPLAILENRPVSVATPGRYTPKSERSWWKFWD